MATAWFLAPYKREVGAARPTRYVIVNDLTPQIRADGGDWTETEVLGQHAIVKVRASAATLTAVAGLAGVSRVPVAALDAPLSTLTTGQRTTLRNAILALGITGAQIDAAFPGDIRTRSLRQVFDFIVAFGRRKVRWDGAAIIDDGPVQWVRPLADVDAAVV